jgi:hypothetical protein
MVAVNQCGHRIYSRIIYTATFPARMRLFFVQSPDCENSLKLCLS